MHGVVARVIVSSVPVEPMHDTHGHPGHPPASKLAVSTPLVTCLPRQAALPGLPTYSQPASEGRDRAHLPEPNDAKAHEERPRSLPAAIEAFHHVIWPVTIAVSIPALGREMVSQVLSQSSRPRVQKSPRPIAHADRFLAHALASQISSASHARPPRAELLKALHD